MKIEDYLEETICAPFSHVTPPSYIVHYLFYHKRNNIKDIIILFLAESK